MIAMFLEVRLLSQYADWPAVMHCADARVTQHVYVSVQVQAQGQQLQCCMSLTVSTTRGAKLRLG